MLKNLIFLLAILPATASDKGDLAPWLDYYTKLANDPNTPSPVIPKKPPFKSSTGTAEESNGFNMASQRSMVDPRTGLLQFELTIGRISFGRRSMEIKIRFEHRGATQYQSPDDLGTRWHLSFPFVSATELETGPGTIVHMGDGRTYQIQQGSVPEMDGDWNTAHKLQYYDTKDIKIKSRGLNWWIGAEDDHFEIGTNGILDKLTTREGDVLTSYYDKLGGPFFLQDEQNNTVFIMKAIANTTAEGYYYRHVMFHSVSSLGHLIYQVDTEGSQNVDPKKLTCISCHQNEPDKPVPTFYFSYGHKGNTRTAPNGIKDQADYELLTNITYPSGLQELVSYAYAGEKLGLSGTSVIQIERLPAPQVHFNEVLRKNVTLTQPSMVSTLDFDPFKTGNDFTGYNVWPATGCLSTPKPGVDELLEVSCPYEYGTRMCSGKQCTLHVFNKFHLEVRTETEDWMLIDSVTKKPYVHRLVTNEYPCNMSMSYEQLKLTCAKFRVYANPIKITSLQREPLSGDHEHVTVEIAEYDDWGQPIMDRGADGVTTYTEYGGSDDFGAHRHIVNKTIVPNRNGTRGNLFVNDDQLPNLVVLYEQQTFVTAHSTNISLPVKEKRYFYWPSTDETEFKTETQLEYFDEPQQPEKHLRLKKRLVRVPAGFDALVTHYDYEFPKDFQVTTIKRITTASGSPMEETRRTIDRPTGLMVEFVFEDNTTETVKYDSLLRPIERRIWNKYKNRSMATLTEYVMSPSLNYFREISPEKDVKEVFLDSLGRQIMERVENDQSLMEETTLHTYSELGELKQQTVVHRKKDGTIILINTTKEYDTLGRTLKATMSTGVSNNYRYLIRDDGSTIVNTYTTNKDNNIGTGNCKRTNSIGQVIASGQATHKFAANISRCSIFDCKTVERKFYDGYGKVTQEFSVSNDKRITNRRAFVHTADGDMVEVHHYTAGQDSRPNAQPKVRYHNAKFDYHPVHSHVRRVYTTHKGTDYTIGTREFDGLGRLKIESSEHVRAETMYDENGWVVEQSVGNSRLTMKRDGYGRLVSKTATLAGSSFYKSEWHMKIDDAMRMTNVRSKSHYGEIEKLYAFDNVTGSTESVIVTTHTPQKQSNTYTAKYDTLGKELYQYDLLLGYKTKFYYDKHGRQHKMAVKEDGVMRLSAKLKYDKFSRPQILTTYDITNNITYQTKFDYDSYGRLQTFDYLASEANSTELNEFGYVLHGYDSFGRLNRKETTGSIETYRYDGISRLRIYECSQKTVSTEILGCPGFYNGQGRVVANLYLAREVYDFDTFNNLISVFSRSNRDDWVHASRWYLYGANIASPEPTVLHQILIKQNIGPNAQNETIIYRVTYDGNGNIASVKAEATGSTAIYEFTHDAMQRPVETRVNGELVINRAHDEDGRIFFQNGTKSGNRLILLDGSDAMYGETNGKTAESFVYVYAAGQKVATIGKDRTRVFFLDAAGSVVVDSDRGGQRFHTYTPYGQRTSENDTDCPRIGFQNIWTDDDGSLVTGNGRLHVPWLHQFAERDPLSPFGQAGINAYSYAFNAPSITSDPSGQVGGIPYFLGYALTSAIGLGDVYSQIASAIKQGIMQTAQEIAEDAVMDDLKVDQNSLSAYTLESMAGLIPFKGGKKGHPQGSGVQDAFENIWLKKDAKYGTGMCCQYARHFMLGQLTPDSRVTVADLARPGTMKTDLMRGLEANPSKGKQLQVKNSLQALWRTNGPYGELEALDRLSHGRIKFKMGTERELAPMTGTRKPIERDRRAQWGIFDMGDVELEIKRNHAAGALVQVEFSESDTTHVFGVAKNKHGYFDVGDIWEHHGKLSTKDMFFTSVDQDGDVMHGSQGLKMVKVFPVYLQRYFKLFDRQGKKRRSDY